MNKTSDFDQSLTARISASDAQGIIVIQIALIATLYFEHGHSLDKRRAIATSFAEYAKMVGPRLRWMHPGKRGFEPMPDTGALDALARLTDETMDEDAGWEIYWHGGQTSEDASPFKICGFGARRWESTARGALSFLTFALPVDWFVGREDTFPATVLRLSRSIKPVHGYGGVGIVESPNRFRSSLHEEEVYALARRHAGIEVDYPTIHALFLKHGIKGVNWITVLSDRWIQALGGRSALESAIHSPATVEHFEGGALLLAGPHPEIGDTNRNLVPASYGPLARALQSVRVKEHPRVHSKGPFDKATFEAWLRRLDAI